MDGTIFAGDINTPRACRTRWEDLIVSTIEYEVSPPRFRLYQLSLHNMDAITRVLGEAAPPELRCTPIAVVLPMLSRAAAYRLPSRIPWVPSDNFRKTADILQEAIVAPLEVQGLICVDYVDYAAALSYGGRLRFVTASGKTLDDIVMSVRLKVKSLSTSVLSAVAWSLHIAIPDSWGYLQIDLIARAAQESLTGSAKIEVLSAKYSGSDTAHARLLLIAGSDDNNAYT